MRNDLDDKARAIQEIANQLGWNNDITTLIDRVNQLDQGLIQEDEFIYIINWHGKCKLIHKLDQLQLPNDSKSHYTIPDILVEVETSEGLKKFIIEIKTSKKNKLSWTEDYFQGLINYSNLVQIPILIAWKWSLFQLWSLFEIKHFEKPNLNYKIIFEKAYQENLMSKYFGEFIIIPFEEFGLNISMKKIKKISEKINDVGNLEIGWETNIDEIYLSGKDNCKVKEIDKGILAILLSMSTEEKIIENETHIVKRYIPYPNKMQFSQNIPIILTKAFSNEAINWLHKSKDNIYPVVYDEFLLSLEKGVEDGLIQYVLFPKPLSEE